MNSSKRCTECKDPTKLRAGFWDGYDEKTGKPTHGYFYDCHNRDCLIKIEELKAAAKNDAEKERVILENIRNGIDFSLVEAYRRKNCILIRDISERLGVTPSLYCDYKSNRKAVPLAVWEVCVEVLR
jgi:hypothetical protein